MPGTEQLSFIRDAGETRRYHGRAVLRPQTVAEHSFHVAMICNWLVGYDPPGLRPALLLAALTHDAAEWQLGDLPAPTKRVLPNVPELKIGGALVPFRTVWDAMEQDLLATVELDYENQLTPEEARVLRLADSVEGALYCIRERAMGNRLIVPVGRSYLDYVREVIAPGASDMDLRASPRASVNARELDLYFYLIREWANAGS